MIRLKTSNTFNHNGEDLDDVTGAVDQLNANRKHKKVRMVMELYRTCYQCENRIEQNFEPMPVSYTVVLVGEDYDEHMGLAALAAVGGNPYDAAEAYFTNHYRHPSTEDDEEGNPIPGELVLKDFELF